LPIPYGAKLQAQMFFFHEALLANLKFSIKNRLRKALAPDFFRKEIASFSSKF